MCKRALLSIGVPLLVRCRQLPDRRAAPARVTRTAGGTAPRSVVSVAGYVSIRRKKVMTVVELRKVLTAYKRANEDRMPEEPLHLTLDQWRSFLLEPRAQVIELSTPEGRPRRAIFGLRVVLHPTM